MRVTLARTAVAGALLLSAAPLAAPSHASCAIDDVCRFVCQTVDHPLVRSICAVT